MCHGRFEFECKKLILGSEIWDPFQLQNIIYVKIVTRVLKLIYVTPQVWYTISKLPPQNIRKLPAISEGKLVGKKWKNVNNICFNICLTVYIAGGSRRGRCVLGFTSLRCCAMKRNERRGERK
jgi:hypothetical protein